MVWLASGERDDICLFAFAHYAGSKILAKQNKNNTKKKKKNSNNNNNNNNDDELENCLDRCLAMLEG